MGVVTELRTMLDSPDEDAGTYRCQSCHSYFETQYHVCPDCGSYRVERAEWQLVE